MSYSAEQRQKNNQLVEIHMDGLSHLDKGDVLRQCTNLWANEADTLKLIKEKKAEIDQRATPEEMDEIFKNLNI